MRINPNPKADIPGHSMGLCSGYKPGISFAAAAGGAGGDGDVTHDAYWTGWQGAGKIHSFGRVFIGNTNPRQMACKNGQAV